MKFKSLFGIMLLGLSGVSATAAEMPSPARAQLEGFIAAFNSGDRAKVEAFGRDHAPPDFIRSQVLDDTMKMFAASGGLDVVDVKESGPLALSGQARERKTGALVRIALAVDPAEPTRITNIQLLHADPPARK